MRVVGTAAVAILLERIFQRIKRKPPEPDTTPRTRSSLPGRDAPRFSIRDHEGATRTRVLLQQLAVRRLRHAVEGAIAEGPFLSEPMRPLTSSASALPPIPEARHENVVFVIIFVPALYVQSEIPF